MLKKLIEKASGDENQQQKGRKVSVMDQIKELLREQIEFSIMRDIRSFTNQQPQQLQQHYPPPPPPPPLQRSSPIGDGERSEKDNVIESFWQWKKEGSDKQSRRLQLCQVQAKFKHEILRLDNIKAMADTSSDIYIILSTLDFLIVLFEV